MVELFRLVATKWREALWVDVECQVSMLYLNLLLWQPPHATMQNNIWHHLSILLCDHTPVRGLLVGHSTMMALAIFAELERRHCAARGTVPHNHTVLDHIVDVCDCDRFCQLLVHSVNCINMQGPEEPPAGLWTVRHMVPPEVIWQRHSTRVTREGFHRLISSVVDTRDLLLGGNGTRPVNSASPDCIVVQDGLCDAIDGSLYREFTGVIMVIVEPRSLLRVTTQQLTALSFNLYRNSSLLVVFDCIHRGRYWLQGWIDKMKTTGVSGYTREAVLQQHCTDAILSAIFPEHHYLGTRFATLSAGQLNQAIPKIAEIIAKGAEIHTSRSSWKCSTCGTVSSKPTR